MLLRRTAVITAQLLAETLSFYVDISVPLSSADNQKTDNFAAPVFIDFVLVPHWHED